MFFLVGLCEGGGEGRKEGADECDFTQHGVGGSEMNKAFLFLRVAFF